MDFAKTVFGLKHPEGYSSKRVRGNFSRVFDFRLQTGGMFTVDRCLFIVLKRARICMSKTLDTCYEVKDLYNVSVSHRISIAVYCFGVNMLADLSGRGTLCFPGLEGFRTTRRRASILFRVRVKVCNRSCADNRHFYDLQMTANIIKDINMKK